MLNIFFLLIMISIVYGEGWNRSNDPFLFDKNFEDHFSSLPLVGNISDRRTAWPGSHWPNYVGGIANRWSSGTPQNFTYKRLSLTELKTKKPYELNELSPAEKFDIFHQNYSYPLVHNVLSELSPNEAPWHGICHGMAPASLNHPEAQTRTLTNGDGITLTFYSSDVAGLMSYYYANVVRTRVLFLGNRCRLQKPDILIEADHPECSDLNAGTFHIVLTNKLGKEGKSFITDVEKYSEVWNHVAVKFQAKAYAEFSPVESSAARTTK
jgi:hypothetical protein